MSAIRLENRPSVADTLVLKDASQAEYRSHAFLYREDTRDSGIFGLPVDVAAAGDENNRWDRPARIVFVQNHGLTFAIRVFALSGYDIVESRFVNGRMKRVNRLNFMPSAEPVIHPTQ